MPQILLFSIAGGFYWAAWRFFWNVDKKNKRGRVVQTSMIGFGLTIFMGTSFGSLATFYPLFDRASEVLEIHQIRLQGDIENQQQELEQLQKDINFAKKRKEILELRKAKPLTENLPSINTPES